MSKHKQAVASGPPAPSGGNRAVMQQAMFDEIDNLGDIEGRGGNARPTLAIRSVEWSASGVADVGDAHTIYDRYIQKAEDVAAVFGGLKRKKDPEQGRKQNASKIRQFLKMGGLKTIDPVKVINVAAGVVKDARAKGTIAYSPFDAMLNIARKQCLNTQVEMTPQDMIDCNQGKLRGDLEEADDLGHVSIRLEKHEKKFGQSDEVTTAREQIDGRIEALGGTTAQKKQKARAAAKEAKKNKVKRS